MRPYPPHPHPWIPSKFDLIMFVILMLIMLVLNLCSCTTPRQQQPSERWDYDAGWGGRVNDHTNVIDVPGFYPAPEWKSAITFKSDTDTCDHVFVQIYWTTDCVCVKCDYLEPCKSSPPPHYLIPTPPQHPAILSTDCRHDLVLTTFAYCPAPYPPCNTCVCMDCGYTYKCN